MAAETTELLENELSEIFSQPIHAEVHQRSQFGDANLFVITMGFTRHHLSDEGPTSSTSIRQSAVVLEDSALELPRFDLDPKLKGVAGKLFSVLSPVRIGALDGLDFPDSPEFTAEYKLIAWVEPSVRVVFNRKLREHLGEHTGWSVKGGGRYLVLYRHNQVVDESDQTTFVQQALAIAERFQEGEESLDQRPELRRETRAEDIEAMADRMGGVVGALLKSQLRKITLTRDELEAFFAEARPRTIPRGMKAQVSGNSLPVVLFGSLFLFVGWVLGGAVLLGLGGDKMAGATILGVFTLVGGTMVYFGRRGRSRKTRVCRHGEMVQAVVKEVKRTRTSVNNQTRHHVTFEFHQRGRQHTATVNAYGLGAKRAKEFRDEQTSLRLLVDPKDASHVLCPELLALWQ